MHILPGGERHRLDALSSNKFSGLPSAQGLWKCPSWESCMSPHIHTKPPQTNCSMQIKREYEHLKLCRSSFEHYRSLKTLEELPPLRRQSPISTRALLGWKESLALLKGQPLQARVRSLSYLTGASCCLQGARRYGASINPSSLALSAEHSMTLSAS